MYRKVADKSRAYKHISRFLHQASMQTRLVCKPCLYAPLIFLPGLYAHRPIRACIEARLLRATRVELPLTTGMAAVLLCTVHSACTLDLPDPRLHRSQASTRDRLICIDPFDFQASIRDVLVCKPGFYPRLYGRSMLRVCSGSISINLLLDTSPSSAMASKRELEMRTDKMVEPEPEPRN